MLDRVKKKPRALKPLFSLILSRWRSIGIESLRKIGGIGDWDLELGLLVIDRGERRRGGTDSSKRNEGLGCLVGLECLLDIIRALRMGSCLSADGGRAGPSPVTTPTGKRLRKGSRKRAGSRNSSFDAKLEQLHRLPGRMYSNGSSGIASLFTQQGRKGTNQDAMIVWEV